MTAEDWQKNDRALYDIIPALPYWLLRVGCNLMEESVAKNTSNIETLAMRVILFTCFACLYNGCSGKIRTFCGDDSTPVLVCFNRLGRNN